MQEASKRQATLHHNTASTSSMNREGDGQRAMFPQSNQTRSKPNAVIGASTAVRQKQRQHTITSEKRISFNVLQQGTSAARERVAHLSLSVAVRTRMHLRAHPRSHIPGFNTFLFGRLISIEAFREIVVNIITHLQDPNNRFHFRLGNPRFNSVYHI